MQKHKDNQLWMFFGLVYVISLLLYAPILLSGRGIETLRNTLLMAGVAFAPSVAGICFIHLTKNKATRRDFWKRVFRLPKAPIGVYITILFGFPTLFVISFFTASAISGEPISLVYLGNLLTKTPVLVQFLFVELIFGAVSEELGWRGYALDELQRRHNALKSSLILGIIWAVWHTPAFLIPGLSQYEMGGIFSLNYVCMMLSVVAGSILHTWAYNNSGRSIALAGILMHFVQNATLILLSGIFDQYTMPVLFWPIAAVLNSAVAMLLVWRYGAHTLQDRNAKTSSSQDSINNLLPVFRR